jgi:hypothetical protein
MNAKKYWTIGIALSLAVVAAACIWWWLGQSRPAELRELSGGFLGTGGKNNIVFVRLATGRMSELVRFPDMTKWHVWESAFDSQTSTLYWRREHLLMAWRSGEPKPRVLLDFSDRNWSTPRLAPDLTGKTLAILADTTPQNANNQTAKLVLYDLATNHLRTICEGPWVASWRPVWLEPSTLLVLAKCPEAEGDARLHQFEQVNVTTGVAKRVVRLRLNASDKIRLSSDKKLLVMRKVSTGTQHGRYLAFSFPDMDLVKEIDTEGFPGHYSYMRCVVGNTHIAFDSYGSDTFPGPKACVGLFLLNLSTEKWYRVSRGRCLPESYLSAAPKWDYEAADKYYRQLMTRIRREHEAARNAPGVFVKRVVSSPNEWRQMGVEDEYREYLRCGPDKTYATIHSYPRVDDHQFVVVEMEKPITKGRGPDFRIHGRYGEFDGEAECSARVHGSNTAEGPWTIIGNVRMGGGQDLPDSLNECLYLRIACAVETYKGDGVCHGSL